MTVGLGAGGRIKVGIDAVESIKLALIALDSVRQHAAPVVSRLQAHIANEITGYIESSEAFINGLFGYFSSDDQAHENVLNGTYRLLPGKVLGKMVADIALATRTDLTQNQHLRF